jgi:hypothetical protein
MDEETIEDRIYTREGGGKGLMGARLNNSADLGNLAWVCCEPRGLVGAIEICWCVERKTHEAGWRRADARA